MRLQYDFFWGWTIGISRLARAFVIRYHHLLVPLQDSGDGVTLVFRRARHAAGTTSDFEYNLQGTQQEDLLFLRQTFHRLTVQCSKFNEVVVSFLKVRRIFSGFPSVRGSVAARKPRMQCRRRKTALTKESAEE